ncbi:aspartate carbamoyltransferase [Candidatus Woesearchaeota archaeon]|jgi:aspartate carbamoyltransferase catalytic subunit|nr:aspartate carbamoyltransferase [Candidatus Woesearchaeota archaeon]MDP6648425.1 aspartate carbamoyltransferase [Candidatus Woesearchaeota archaeon]|tara:strand:- start:32436 stop:33353 length:918 start_codon:yes stop_codon:yes gene_type:complete
MDFKNRDIISINDFSKEELLHILKVVKQIENKPKNNLLKGKLLATLFFEPSTRTRLSFISAMEQLGGEVLGFADSESTSRQKGESLWDTIRMTEQYADAIIIRHPLEGSGRLAAEAASIPVINGGDGSNQHPTQTILDMYTILKTKGKLENLHVGFVGDLKYGRTVHSLVMALSHFSPTFYFIAPDALQIPESYLDELFQKKIEYNKTSDLTRFSRELDILYVTRIQKERFPDPLEYEKFKDVYTINKSFLQNVKKDLKIMHPLPRVSEIDKSVDATQHAAYFEQAAFGIPVRKALLALVLGKVK